MMARRIARLRQTYGLTEPIARLLVGLIYGDGE